jgi:hypothetical protein
MSGHNDIHPSINSTRPSIPDSPAHPLTAVKTYRQLQHHIVLTARAARVDVLQEMHQQSMF